MSDPVPSSPPRFVVKPAVPILDEHELVDSQGNSTRIDADALQKIADNCNRRVEETGDECPLVIGHTVDDAPETEQPPVVGYARDFFVGDLFRTGKKALFATFKVFADKVDQVRNYPRRSVELWLERMEVDPISLLGATTPERDLGLLQLERRGSPVRYSRVYDDATCDTPPCDPVTSPPEPNETSAPMADEMKPDDAPKGDADKSTLSDADVAKVVAAIMQTDVFKQLEAIISEEEAGPDATDAGHPDDAFPPSGGDAPTPPPGPSGPPSPPPVDKEKRTDHEAPPVQYNDLDKVKMQRDAEFRDLKAKLSRNESEVARLNRENEDFKRKYRRSEREKDLRAMVSDEGFSFDVADELDLVTDMSEDVYKVHVDRIKKNYSRAPVRVGLIPTAENPSIFGTTVAATKGQVDKAVELATSGEMSYEQALRKVTGR